jgi:energy-coupling factor transporter ATP-binding protein EcfA2
MNKKYSMTARIIAVALIVWGIYELYQLVERLILGVNWIQVGWIIAGIAFLLLACVVGYTVVEHRYYRPRAAKEMKYVRIFPYADTPFKTDRIFDLMDSYSELKRPFWERITRGREWLQMYYVCIPTEKSDKGEIQIYVGFPVDRAADVPEKLAHCYPMSEIQKVDIEEIPFLDKTKGEGGVFRFHDRKRKGLPLRTLEADKITNILSALRPNTMFSVGFSLTSPRLLKKQIRKTRKYLYKAAKFDRETMKKSDLEESHGDISYQNKTLSKRSQNNQGGVFEVSLAIWSHEQVRPAVNAINAAVKADNKLYFKNMAQNHVRLTPFYYWFQRYDAARLFNFSNTMIWTGHELVGLLHLPEGSTPEIRRKKLPHLYNRIQYIVSGQNTIPDDEFVEGIKVGHTMNPAQPNRDVFLLEEILRKMCLIIGKTGSGKSALALTMIRYLIEQRLQGNQIGFTAIDPKADLAKTVLTFLSKMEKAGLLPDELKNIIHYFDVMSEQYAFSLNPLEKPKGVKLDKTIKNKIVKNTLSVMKNAYPGESINFEKYGKLAIKCLLEDSQPHNILAIGEFLGEESPLRDRIYKKLVQGDVEQRKLAKKIKELSNGFGSREIQPVLNRLERLVENPLTERIFGQFETNIKPLEYMEKNHIVLFNLDGIEEEETRLVMGYVLMEYHKSAHKRHNKAQNHYCIIDEAHEVQLPVLHEKILPKDRAFGLCMVLMTQFLDQFNQDLYDTISELSGTYIACTSGPKSARVMETLTTDRCLQEDIQNLRSLTAIIDTEDSSGERTTFLIRTEPPLVFDQNGNPTYYSKNSKNKTRIDDEREQAYDHALTKIGYPLMGRDCRTIQEIDKDINLYLERLWGEKADSSYAFHEVSAATKIEETKAKALEHKQKEVAELWGVDEE